MDFHFQKYYEICPCSVFISTSIVQYYIIIFIFFIINGTLYYIAYLLLFLYYIIYINILSFLGNVTYKDLYFFEIYIKFKYYLNNLRKKI